LAYYYTGKKTMKINAFRLAGERAAMVEK